MFGLYNEDNLLVAFSALLLIACIFAVIFDFHFEIKESEYKKILCEKDYYNTCKEEGMR